MTAGVMAVVLLLLVVLLEMSLEDPRAASGYSLQSFRKLYADPFLYEALRNPLGMTGVSTFTALFFAVPIALVAERTTLPRRSLIFLLMVATALIPGFFTAMGWKLLLHPRIDTDVQRCAAAHPPRAG